jgi:hypothetical protein
MTLDGFEPCMTRVAIIAAMPGELKPLVLGWQHESRNGVDLWRSNFDHGEWVAACAGAGVDAATRAFVQVEKDGAISSAVSIGWAGALSEEIEAGRSYWVSGVVDARTGERFLAEEFEVAERDGDLPTHPSDKNKNVAKVGHPRLWLVTSPTVADEAEKRRPPGLNWLTWRRQRLRDWRQCVRFLFFASKG